MISRVASESESESTEFVLSSRSSSPTPFISLISIQGPLVSNRTHCKDKKSITCLTAHESKSNWSYNYRL